MKVKIMILGMIFMTQFTQAQKLICKNGHVWFHSKTPIEEIEAHNRQSVSILDPNTGDLQFSLLIKAFEFKIALMQEHFNENYMESDKYPKAGFTGKITHLDKIDFKKDGVYPVQVTGDLTIHHVTKPITTQGTLEVKDGSVIARAKFVVIPEEYGIDIPALVKDKIAKEVDINVDATYSSN
jgi:hypothetical protein